MMNQSLSITVSVAALTFAFTSASDVQARCESRILNKNFSCFFISESTSFPNGETCLEFKDEDTLDPPKFRLFDNGETSIVGSVLYNCTCDPVGNFARTHFNRSREKFSCTGLEPAIVDNEEVNFPWAIRGQIGRSGRTITAHQVNILANSFVLRCRMVSSCGDRSLSAQKLLGENAIEVQKDLEDFYALRAKRRLLESQTE